MLWGASLLWLGTVWLSYTHRPPAQAPVGALVSTAWQSRLERVGQASSPWLHDLCRTLAGCLGPDSPPPSAAATAQDWSCLGLAGAWLVFTLFAVGVALGRLTRPGFHDRNIGNQHGLEVTWRRAWEGFLAWRLILLLAAPLLHRAIGSVLGLQLASYLLSGLLACMVLPLPLWGGRPNFALGLAGYGWGVLGVMLCELLLNVLGHSTESGNPLLQILSQASGPSLGLWFLALVVIGPALEEIWFRGILLSGFTKIMGTAAAIAMSAWVFALIHVDPQALLQLFALGVAFGWVRWRAGGWESSYVSHLLWNFSTFLLVSLA